MKHSPAAVIVPSLFLAVACTAPPAPETAAEWTSLFDGQTLEGWTASENPESFRVEDGAIACDGPRSHLFYVGDGYDAEFRNFELSAEVKTRPGTNSGLYFHTTPQDEGWPAQGFEIQVNNSQKPHGDYLELKKTGSLYGYRNMYAALAPDDEWFEVRAEVRGKRVKVWLEGTLLVDYREPDTLPPSWTESFQVLGSGTFALQCHDPESPVSYRNLKVRPLPDDAGDPGPGPEADDAFIRKLELAKANFPLLDLHVHIKGGLELEPALELSRKSGMAFGLAVNCGKGFPVETDEGALEFLETMKDQPVFIGMQGEGREWVDMFSPEVRAEFDYVFTDAMTFTDHRGERTRIWVAEEVEVGDEQAYMDMLVDRTVGILESEPIDIWVNPTFLPEVIADDYDRLWTEKRMKTVIDAAVANGIAIEINGRYEIPSQGFLRLAKEAGARFTIGTNNAGADDLGDWSYPLEMVDQLELKWQDMYVPGHAPSRAQKELEAGI